MRSFLLLVLCTATLLAAEKADIRAFIEDGSRATLAKNLAKVIHQIQVEEVESVLKTLRRLSPTEMWSSNSELEYRQMVTKVGPILRAIDAEKIRLVAYDEVLDGMERWAFLVRSQRAVLLCTMSFYLDEGRVLVMSINFQSGVAGMKKELEGFTIFNGNYGVSINDEDQSDDEGDATGL